MQTFTAKDDAPSRHIEEPRLASEFERWLILVRRRRWLIICALLLAAGVGAVYYRMAPRVYKSTASVLVVETGAAMAAAQVREVVKQQDNIPTHIRLILSPAVLSSAVARLEQEHVAEIEQLPPLSRLSMLAGSLQVGSDNETKVIDVSYRTREPASAVRIVDAVVSAYLEFVNETHRTTAQEILDVMTRQRTQIEQQLVQKEAQLRQMQQETGVLALRHNQTSVLAAKLAILNDALTRARLKRMEEEARLKTFQLGLDADQPIELLAIRFGDSIGKEILGAQPPGTGPDFKTEPKTPGNGDQSADKVLLDHYRDIYGPNHPRRQELEARLNPVDRPGQPSKLSPSGGVAERRQNIADSIKQFLQQGLDQDQILEEDLEKKIEAEKAQTFLINDRNVQLMALETEVERLRKLFEVVIIRMKDAGINPDYEQVRVRVISPPTRPQSPVSPNGMWVAMVSLCIGLGSGLALCRIFEWLDTSFRGPDDVEWHMRLPILGHVPHISGKTDVELWASTKPRSAETEAFRALRSAILFAPSMPRRLLVTSPETGDGKTLLVTNLAIVLAQSGRRTLILDADLRRPRIRELFDGKRSGGVCGLLRDAQLSPEKLAAEIQPTEVENLSILCSGPRPSNPAELLINPRFQQVLDWAGERFDHVLIDSPPVLAVTDACILGQAGDAVLLVLKADKSDRDNAVRARDTLVSMNCKVLGVAMNDIHVKNAYGYYYYGYGRHGHRRTDYAAYSAAPEDNKLTGPDADAPEELDPPRTAA